MNVIRVLTRSALALSVLALAACQTAPKQQVAATQPSESTAAGATPSAQSEAPLEQAAEQGAPVAVFLADMTNQQGWRPVQVGADTTLYLDPQPIVTRDDLTGIQAGSNRDGVGLLALMLSEDAKTRIQDLTTRNPNKRLALVVGTTLMAAPSYTTPVETGQLIFPVGTEENATAAARAIAGVNGNAASGAMPAAGTGSAPGVGTGGTTGMGAGSGLGAGPSQ